MNTTKSFVELATGAEAIQTLLVKVISAVYAIISLGFFSNVAVAVVVGNILIRLGRQLPNRHMLVYVLALCTVDALVLGTLPMLVTQIYLQRWIFGQTLCTVYWTIESINKTLSTFILTCLSFDRYLAVRFPQRCLHIRTVRGALYILSFCIIFAALILMPVYLHAEVTYVRVDSEDGNGTAEITVPTCAFVGQSTFVFTVFTLCYFVPFACMSCFYGSMLARLRHKSKKLGLRQGRVRRVTKKTLTLVILYFVFWTPYWVMTLRSVISDALTDARDKSNKDEEFITTTATVSSSASSTTVQTEGYDKQEEGAGDALSAVTFAVMCVIHSGCYLNSAINPILYALLNRELRRQHYAAMNCAASRGSVPLSTNGNVGPRNSLAAFLSAAQMAPRSIIRLGSNEEVGRELKEVAAAIVPSSSRSGRKRSLERRKRPFPFARLWQRHSSTDSKMSVSGFHRNKDVVDVKMPFALYSRLVSMTSVGGARRSWPAYDGRNAQRPPIRL